MNLIYQTQVTFTLLIFLFTSCVVGEPWGGGVPRVTALFLAGKLGLIFSCSSRGFQGLPSADRGDFPQRKQITSRERQHPKNKTKLSQCAARVAPGSE